MPLDEAYFVWLYSQVGEVENKNRSRSYWKLMKFLYEKEFLWLKKIELDANRAQDGKDLRLSFMRETRTKVDEPGWLDMPCSMLEMLIALAWKLEFEGGRTQAFWFWDMIGNLGLLECTDALELDENIVDYILDKMISRQYAENGAGGLFPLKAPDNDQRDVQLWYQAQAYLLERL